MISIKSSRLMYEEENKKAPWWNWARWLIIFGMWWRKVYCFIWFKLNKTISIPYVCHINAPECTTLSCILFYHFIFQAKSTGKQVFVSCSLPVVDQLMVSLVEKRLTEEMKANPDKFWHQRAWTANSNIPLMNSANEWTFFFTLEWCQDPTKSAETTLSSVGLLEMIQRLVYRETDLLLQTWPLNPMGP